MKKALKILALFFLVYLLIELFLIINPFYFEGNSKNFKDGKFFNSFEEEGLQTKNSTKDFFKWMLNRWKTKPEWSVAELDKYAKYKPYTKTENTKGLEVVFIGHASFLIQIEGVNILTDPTWNTIASPVPFIGPKRYTKPGVGMQELPKIDYVLISHSHYDHMDVPTIKKLKEMFDPTFILGLGGCKFLKDYKSLELKCVEKDWGERWHVKPNFDIFFEKAKHWSKRSLFDANKMLWGSFVVKSPNYKVYFAGDTGYGKHFEMIGREYGGFDVALLPIGAYQPRYIMQYSHINPEEAIKAHKELKAKTSIGMHFKTFQLADDGFNEPVEDLRKTAPNNFITLDFGERYISK